MRQRKRGGSIHQQRRFGHLVDQTNPARGRCRQRAAGQHHVECGRRADQPWQSHAAAPAGIDAQLDFGQADAGRRIVAGNAIAARQRQFGAAAHAETVNRGDRRDRQFGQALEHLLAATDRVADHAFFVERLELPDVGAGDKAAGLGRADHQAFGWVDREPLQQPVQFDQDVLGEGVDGRSGAVEGQHQHAVLAGEGLPVLDAKTVERGNTKVACHLRHHPFRYWVSRYHPDVVPPPSNHRRAGAIGCR